MSLVLTKYDYMQAYWTMYRQGIVTWKELKKKGNRLGFIVIKEKRIWKPFDDNFLQRALIIKAKKPKRGGRR